MILEKDVISSPNANIAALKKFLGWGLSQERTFFPTLLPRLSLSVIHIFIAKEEDKGTRERPEREQKDKDALDWSPWNWDSLKQG